MPRSTIAVTLLLLSMRPILADDLEARLDEIRHAAFVERVHSVATCGHLFAGGDARRAHGFVSSGDDWLRRADEFREEARKSGLRTVQDAAWRHYETARVQYIHARRLSPLRSYEYEAGRRPAPLPEGWPADWHSEAISRGKRPEVPREIWGRWDEVPVDDPGLPPPSRSR